MLPDECSGKFRLLWALELQSIPVDCMPLCTVGNLHYLVFQRKTLYVSGEGSQPRLC